MSTIILCFQSLGILFITALIHESGHALACRFCGIPVIHIMVFSGTPKYSVKFGPYFSIGWFPYGGYVATPFIYNDEVDFFITICGPLANLIIAIGLFFTAGMYQFFFAFNAFVAVYALMPLGKKKDGYRLLLILKKWYNFRKHCR